MTCDCNNEGTMQNVVYVLKFNILLRVVTTTLTYKRIAQFLVCLSELSESKYIGISEMAWLAKED